MRLMISRIFKCTINHESYSDRLSICTDTRNEVRVYMHVADILGSRYIDTLLSFDHTGPELDTT